MWNASTAAKFSKPAKWKRSRRKTPQDSTAPFPTLDRRNVDSGGGIREIARQHRRAARNQSRERAFRCIQISSRRRRGAHTRQRFRKIRLQLERSAKTQRSIL